MKRAGHTPAKAAEIALDAKRGDEYAIKWIAITRMAVAREMAM